MLHAEIAPALQDKRGAYTSQGMLSRLGAKKLKAKVEKLLQESDPTRQVRRHQPPVTAGTAKSPAQKRAVLLRKQRERQAGSAY